MGTKTASLLLVGSLLGSSALVVAGTLPPAPLPDDAPATVFSAMRAARHAEVIAVEPHPTGSEANARVRASILGELDRLGIPTAEQEDGDLVNVLGRIQGSGSSDAILLTAHYDSTLQSPGANDDAAGVAVLLETARALQASGEGRNSVVFLFTDQEEGGNLGAEAFVERHPWAGDVRVVIGFDAGGITGPGVLSAIGPGSGWLIRQWLAADPEAVGSSAVLALGQSNTDFGRVFRPAGFPGYAFDLYWDKEDGPQDNLANLDLGSLQHQGDHALTLALHLRDLDPLAVPSEADPVFSTVPRLFSVSYPSSLAAPLGLGIVALLVTVILVGLRRGRLTGRGLAFGAVAALVGAALAPLPVVVVSLLVGPFEPRVTADWDYRLLDSPPTMTLIVLGCLGLVIGWHRLAPRLRPTSLADRSAGATVPLAAGLVSASLVMPALSFALAWPLLVSTGSVLSWSSRAPPESVTLVRLAGLLLLGVTSIVVAGPTIVLGLFEQLPVALASLGGLCAFLVPHIDLIVGWRRPLTSPSNRR